MHESLDSISPNEARKILQELRNVTRGILSRKHLKISDFQIFFEQTYYSGKFTNTHAIYRFSKKKLTSFHDKNYEL